MMRLLDLNPLDSAGARLRRFRVRSAVVLFNALFHLGIAALLLAFVTAASAVDTAAPSAVPGKRVALVIGNGAYGDLGALPNPPNDASDMVSALEALNFEVSWIIDGNIDTLQSALRRFGRSAVNADIALFYYAGHGMALDGENYLVPIGSDINIEPDLAYEALSLSEVRRQLEFTDAALKMIILDACRDNPLGRTLKRNTAQLGRNIETDEGLARVEVAPASGMLIAYATAPGSLALDGSNQRNSPFTGALLTQIGTPNIDVRVMFGRVRSSVVAATKSYQTPWVEDGMLGEFAFNPVAPEPEPEAEPAALPPDLVAWRAIAESDDPADFEAFLESFPASFLASAARDRVALLTDPEAELDAWNALQTSSDISAHEVFLRRYPSGPYSGSASLALQGLLWTQLAASGDIAGMETFLARFSSGPFATLARLTIENLRSKPAPAAAVSRASPEEAPPAEDKVGTKAPAAMTLALAETRPEVDDESAQRKAQRALTLVNPLETEDEAAKAAALARIGEVAPNLIQIALKALGHYDGRIDGVFGPGSRRAATQFQEQRGFSATGELRPEEIVALIAAAAETGNTDSQNTYGIMFATGAGVVQNYAAAAKWFRLSAEAGNAYGQMNLGLLYKDGLGVAEDSREARRLLEEAAENGQAEARQLLAEPE